MIRLRTIDAHAGGAPLRLIVEGFPAPRGATMSDKCAWVKKKHDRLRRMLMLEPRGHADMCGAVLTEPASPGSHAGLLFMDNEGYSPMCGHGVIAVTTIALERGLLMPGGDGTTVVYDSVAGTVRARATLASAPRGASPEAEARVARVAFVNVPSFVLHAGLTVKIGTRNIRADVAFGGAFYAIVDSEAVGLPIDRAHLPELRRAGVEIKRAVEAARAIAHPLDPTLQGIDGTVFTGPPDGPQADLRNVTIFAGGQADRSPCGTGTSAVMAVVDAMGLLANDKSFGHESLIGTCFRGRISARTTVGEYQAIVPEIEGSAWITGEHTFVVDENDPLAGGFRI